MPQWNHPLCAGLARRRANLALTLVGGPAPKSELFPQANSLCRANSVVSTHRIGRRCRHLMQSHLRQKRSDTISGMISRLSTRSRRRAGPGPAEAASGQEYISDQECDIVLNNRINAPKSLQDHINLALKVPKCGAVIGAQIIAYWRNRPELLRAEVLDFSGNAPIHKAWVCSAIWSFAPEVKVLRLSQVDLSGKFWYYMNKLPQSLVRFELDNCNLNDKNIKELAKNSNTSKLTSLSIRNNPIGDEGIVALLTSSTFTLTDLDARNISASREAFTHESSKKIRFERLLTDYPDVNPDTFKPSHEKIYSTNSAPLRPRSRNPLHAVG